MSIKRRSIIVTLVVAAAAFAAGPVLYMPEDPVDISTTQLALLMFLGLFEVLMLGAAVALTVYGRRSIRRLPAQLRPRASAAFWSMVFLLAQWWPHLGMHQKIGVDIEAIIVIDYLFHLPMFLAGGIVTYAIVATINDVAKGRIDRGELVGSH